ncbi:MAG: hypothetical protein EA384_02510 [Spirochaetaceae bacterium]|nr:MAG: hypothetical protein EA384_02510 [Spirochaetaceae bacterium]
MISEFVSRNFYWVFLGILIVNLTQRKHRGTAQKKRLATLYLSIAALVLYSAGQLVLNYGATDLYFLPVAVVVVAVVFRFREHTFPFTLRCVQSGKRLDMNTILYRDSNTLPEYDQPASGEPADGATAETPEEDLD